MFGCLTQRWSVKVVLAMLAVTLILVTLARLQATVGVMSSGALPPAKQAFLTREAQDRKAALTQIRPSHDAVQGKIAALQATIQAQPTPAPDSSIGRVHAGAGTIIESGQAPFSSQNVIIVNHWWEPKSKENLIVYAGVDGQDRSQGMLIVSEMAPDYSSGFGEYAYPTPTKAGAVRVVAAIGERLTLASTSGVTFVFDVASRTFVS